MKELPGEHYIIYLVEATCLWERLNRRADSELIMVTKSFAIKEIIAGWNVDTDTDN